MSGQEAPPSQKTTLAKIIGFSMGEGATSLTMNGISGFAMLFYTQALGLDFKLAGLAFMVATIWDAITDPIMGHISDNTRSRWGRRHQYILVGGLLMAVCFFFMWNVPSFFTQREMLLFTYVMGINILYRTAFTIFSIPYMALGFEVCTDYHQRSQLQSVKSALNMLVNLLGPALAWSLFFPDNELAGQPEPTSMAGNYERMGTVFTIAAAIFAVVVVWATRYKIRDSRPMKALTGNGLWAFYKDSLDILRDRYLRLIMTFFCVGMVAATFVATLQMYLYVYFVHLTALQKTLTHGGGMVLFGIGALFATPLSRRFDKKSAVCIGAAIAATANLTAGIIFLGGILKPDTVWHLGGITIPIAVIAFGLCNMMNWFGSGIYFTLAGSMLADVAEVDELHSGVRKDGGYAAFFSFTTKLVSSIATFLATASLAWAGIAEKSDIQTPQAIHTLVFLTFGLGCLFALSVIPIAWRYPITKEFMDEVKVNLNRRKVAEAQQVPSALDELATK